MLYKLIEKGAKNITRMCQYNNNKVHLEMFNKINFQRPLVFAILKLCGLHYNLEQVGIGRTFNSMHFSIK